MFDGSAVVLNYQEEELIMKQLPYKAKSNYLVLGQGWRLEKAKVVAEGEVQRSHSKPTVNFSQNEVSSHRPKMHRLHEREWGTQLWVGCTFVSEGDKLNREG